MRIPRLVQSTYSMKLILKSLLNMSIYLKPSIFQQEYSFEINQVVPAKPSSTLVYYFEFIELSILSHSSPYVFMILVRNENVSHTFEEWEALILLISHFMLCIVAV